MFIENKYYACYRRIVADAQRHIYSITESHHIIPKSMGGSNSKDNLVSLTPRQHFICHQLLTKCVEQQFRPKMIKALYLMSKKAKITAHRYELIRSEFIESCKGPKNWTELGKSRLVQSAKSRTGDRNPFFGKSHTEETRKSIGDKNRGKLPSNARRVVADGVEYESAAACARAKGCVPALVLYRIKSPKYEYSYSDGHRHVD